MAFSGLCYTRAMTDYKPGLYAKGDQTKTASTAAQAVALRFDGFRPVAADELAETLEQDVDYTSLKERARALGLPAKGKKADLARAVADAEQAVAEHRVGDRFADLGEGEPDPAPES